MEKNLDKEDVHYNPLVKRKCKRSLSADAVAREIAKAMEVLWKQERFKDLVVMMGGFHLFMTLLAIIGSRFGDAGLKDVAVHSEVIAEGSIDSILSGKHYNRGVNQATFRRL